jgi:hypothetical protein
MRMCEAGPDWATQGQYTTTTITTTTITTTTITTTTITTMSTFGILAKINKHALYGYD